MNLPILSPSEFVAILNQTLDAAYPVVQLEGEVSNFKISKNRWVYFDICDDQSKVKCFSTVYSMPAPVDDGMMVKIVANPRLHPQFGFSLNVSSLQFSGEGSIKKAADKLRLKLEKEGLFAEDRKRIVPYPPKKIALVASGESAGYKDFIKILSDRYGGILIELINVSVQGEQAVREVSRAIEIFNKRAELADVLVITRGGGSTDDLQAFSSEQVTRAVASSRIPTVVAIGHEIDVSLAELAADVRASTPSNAAETLVPDRLTVLNDLKQISHTMTKELGDRLREFKDINHANSAELGEIASMANKKFADNLEGRSRTLDALSPKATIKRGYSIVRKSGKAVKQASSLSTDDRINIEFADESIGATIN